MNRGVVLFLKEERFVAALIASGVSVDGVYLQVSPLAAPSTRVTVSGVPPFISDELLERELLRFGKLASGFRAVGLGCKSDKLKHVQSFKRQVFMFLSCPSQMLDVSFRVKHGEGQYMVYASTGDMKCFQCGVFGHKRINCPRRAEPGAGSAEERTDAAPQDQDPAADAGEGSSGQTDRQAGEQRSVSGIETAEGKTVAEEAQAVSEESVGSSGKKPSAGEPDSQAAGAQVRGGGAGAPESVAGEEEGEMESETDSDCASITDSQSLGGDLYTLEDINTFLDETFGKSIKVSDYFSDAEKFIKSVLAVQKVCGFDLLDEKNVSV